MPRDRLTEAESVDIAGGSENEGERNGSRGSSAERQPTGSLRSLVSLVSWAI